MSVIIRSGLNKYRPKRIPDAEVWAFHRPRSLAWITRFWMRT